LAISVSASHTTVQVRGSYFYVWSALACAAVAFLGFAPTYFAPLVQGSFKANPIVHIHGIVFFSWTLFFTYQAWLVADGRTMRHRDVGLMGISFATAMTFLGLLVAVESAARAGALGFLSEAKHFMVVPVAGIITFAVLFAFAIANVKNKEVHKRLMLVATASILDAAVARWFLAFLAPPLAPGASPVPTVDLAVAPALLVDLIIVAGIAHDWRTRGRPHPAYLIAGGAVLVQQLLRAPVSTTAVWDGIAVWLMHVAG
jgi:hypothetical protein